MIDLHIHTNYSDGADDLITVLKKAEENNLEYISITDHDNCNVYKELKQIDVKQYYSGKIIPGIEIKCGYRGRLIEVLGYKIDTDKLQAWADEFYKDKTKPILQQKYFELLYDKCLQLGLVLSDKEKIEFDNKTDWASVSIYKEIKKHKENEEKVPADFWAEFNIFSKKYCGNPNHILYIDKTKDYPSLSEAIDAIRNSGGIVFVAHLYIYKWAEDKDEMLEDIVKNFKPDGFECMHSEFSEEQIKHIMEKCKEHHLYMSGGSDYHGVNKPNIEMKVGKGSLKVEAEIIKDWVSL